jgi:hypothetical protein
VASALKRPLTLLARLLVIVVLGWGAIGSAAPLEPCWSACACDEDEGDATAHADAVDDGCADEASHESGEDEPTDQCPMDCPGCACGAGAMAAVTLTSLRGRPLGDVIETGERLTSRWAGGVSSSVFRPPRA